MPELQGLGDDRIHDPGDDRPGDYPEPLIGHREARERALAVLHGFSAGTRDEAE